MKIKLIVGLGNPGKEYNNTRHNMGFNVIDKIAEKYNVTTWKERYDGLFFDEFVNMCHVIFLKPQKYMNLSGDVIIKYVNFFNIDINDILIISDDLDTPVGNIKLKLKGSSGGHNGLKNIEDNLNSSEYRRIKIGISNNKEMETKDYVLGKISKDEKKILDNVIDKVAEIALLSLSTPFEVLMSKYNTKNNN